MTKGNVLVIGNSGVGKSTLINAVLGEECAVTGYGITGTTQELSIYENGRIPFRIIDTVGFEPSFRKASRAVRSVRKWSRDSAVKEERKEERISVIWCCVEGTSRKLFPDTIRIMAKAVSMWPSVPVIAVITKSYSLPERRETIMMVHEAFSTHKKLFNNLKRIIPVVAMTYRLNDDAFAPPDGITDLIEATNDLLPEGIRASETDVARYKMDRRRAFAHSSVGVATASAVIVGAVPIPFPDAAILTPLEIAEINTVSRIYGINKDEKLVKFVDSNVEVGTVSTAARAAVNALKSIPGVNAAASAVNAVIAGSIVAAIGECSIAAFEQISAGNRSLAETEWVKELTDSKLSEKFVSKVSTVLKRYNDAQDPKKLAQLILDVFFR
ncbi:MAG: 50S ribosome-binding GTPase [Oscillospiraceae bacterium]|nr:50S ribosome-binding GTPase [Oscillospiraceae bacterium]